MTPSPNREHLDFEGTLEMYLRLRWAKPNRSRVIHNPNLASPGGWPKDYRIPDLVLMKPERFGIDHNEYFEGAPSAVVEIQSPGEESEEKLPFYAKLGVPEVWLIHRDTKESRVLVLRDGKYELEPPGAEGWHLSREIGVEMRRGRPGKLEIRLQGNDSTREELPED